MSCARCPQSRPARRYAFYMWRAMTEQPVPIITVIDEAAPEDRHGIYKVGSAAILSNVTDVRTGLTPSVLTEPGRRR